MRFGMRGVVVVVVLVFACLIVAGCSGAAKQPTLATDLEGSWVVESFGGVDELRPSAEGVTTTLDLKAGTASGNGGVNSYSTTYQTPEAGSLTFAEVATTSMAGEEDAMNQETGFFTALGMTERYEIDAGGKLVLSDESENTLLVLKRK